MARGNRNSWNAIMEGRPVRRNGQCANDALYGFYYQKLKQLQISRFKWENLPENGYLDDRIIETILYDYGKAVFSKDEVLGYLVLWVQPEGSFDVHMIPQKFMATGANGYNRMLNKSDAVLFFDNNLMEPGRAFNWYYAERLAEIESAIRVNLKANKTPIVVQVPANEKLAMQNIYKKYDENTPVIFVSDKFDKTKISSIDTRAPYIIDKLENEKQCIWAEALAGMGYDSSPIEKAERLITTEVEANNDQINANRAAALSMRQEACERINDMFGLDIQCRWRTATGDPAYEQEEGYEEEEEEEG